MSRLAAYLLFPCLIFASSMLHAQSIDGKQLLDALQTRIDSLGHIHARWHQEWHRDGRKECQYQAAFWLSEGTERIAVIRADLFPTANGTYKQQTQLFDQVFDGKRTLFVQNGQPWKERKVQLGKNPGLDLDIYTGFVQEVPYPHFPDLMIKINVISGEKPLSYPEYLGLAEEVKVIESQGQLPKKIRLTFADRDTGDRYTSIMHEITFSGAEHGFYPQRIEQSWIVDKGQGVTHREHWVKQATEFTEPQLGFALPKKVENKIYVNDELWQHCDFVLDEFKALDSNPTLGDGLAFKLPAGAPIHHYDAAKQLLKATIRDAKQNAHTIYSAADTSSDEREESARKFIVENKDNEQFSEVLPATKIFPKWSEARLPSVTAPDRKQPNSSVSEVSQAGGQSGSWWFYAGCLGAVAGFLGMVVVWRSGS